jgi:hypothetical protein
VASANPSADTGLGSVSCVTSTSCVAVGIEVDADGTYRGLAETFDGGSWTATRPDAPTPGFFHSVSCSSPTACIAVGQRIGSTNAVIIDSWNGVRWSVPRFGVRGKQNLLLGVSCPAAASCVAVGIHDQSRGLHALIETNAPRP